MLGKDMAQYSKLYLGLKQGRFFNSPNIINYTTKINQVATRNRMHFNDHIISWATLTMHSSSFSRDYFVDRDNLV